MVAFLRLRDSTFMWKRKVVCILGLNGAGKSTTINMITTLLPMDEGLIKVDGLRRC